MSTTTQTGRPAVHWLGYGACALAGCFWGMGFYCGRLALDEMSVEYMVLYRFFFALLGMLPVLIPALFTTRARFTASEWRMLLLCAAFGIPIQFLLQFHGLALTTVSHAALMVGTMPVLLAVAAALFAGERLDWLGWLALFGSSAGTLLIELGGTHGRGVHPGGTDQPSLAGDLLVVLSLCLSLAWILLSKKLMERHSAIVVTAYTILTGTIMLAAWILTPVLFKPLCMEFGIPNHSAPMPFLHISATAWTALAVSGIACTATAALLWNWGLHHVPASRAGVFLNIEPALGSILGVRLLGEHLGPHAWIGGALILGAAITLTTRGGHGEPAVILE